MKAKILRNIGTDSNLPHYKEGEIAEGNDELINKLCELGLAEKIIAVPTEPIKAIPPKPKKQKDSE